MFLFKLLNDLQNTLKYNIHSCFDILFLQIYFSNKSKEAVEEVFVTDLEVDFPEFRKAQAAHKGIQ